MAGSNSAGSISAGSTSGGSETMNDGGGPAGTGGAAVTTGGGGAANTAVAGADAGGPAGGAAAGAPPVVVFSSVGKQVSALKGANTEYTLFDRKGPPGVLTHMYFSGLGVSALRIRVYVDGETSPSIDMANDLGTGFAYGGGALAGAIPPQNSQMGATGGIFNNYQIPYGREVKVTVYQMWDFGDPDLWWTIEGAENLPTVVGGTTLPPTARLKLYTNEWVTVPPLDYLTLCNIPAGTKGRVYQVMIAGSSSNWNFMEGMVRGYFDQEAEPVLLSSGLEDLFLGAGYFWQAQLFWGETSGLTSIDTSKHSFSAYRFFPNDPLVFGDGLKMTLRSGEQVNGQTLYDPQPATLATYTWVYQW